MPDLYILTAHPLPESVQGVYAGFALRPLHHSERISIEDTLFAQGKEQRTSDAATALIIPNIIPDLNEITELLTLAEFSLSIISSSGHPSFSIAALFSEENCTNANHLPLANLPEPKFLKSMSGIATAQWLYVCSLARKNLKERMHITADRYVRYARSENIADALLDLCICLESLIDSQTEIAFRFGISLAKILGDTGEEAENNAVLLSKLYSLRSKIAHGDPEALKLCKKIQPELHTIKQLARRIITVYLLYMSKNSRDDWKAHIRRSLFS